MNPIRNPERLEKALAAAERQHNNHPTQFASISELYKLRLQNIEKIRDSRIRDSKIDDPSHAADSRWSILKTLPIIQMPNEVNDLEKKYLNMIEQFKSEVKREQEKKQASKMAEQIKETKQILIAPKQSLSEKPSIFSVPGVNLSANIPKVDIFSKKLHVEEETPAKFIFKPAPGLFSSVNPWVEEAPKASEALPKFNIGNNQMFLKKNQPEPKITTNTNFFQKKMPPPQQNKNTTEKVNEPQSKPIFGGMGNIFEKKLQGEGEREQKPSNVFTNNLFGQKTTDKTDNAFQNKNPTEKLFSNPIFGATKKQDTSVKPFTPMVGEGSIFSGGYFQKQLSKKKIDQDEGKKDGNQNFSLFGQKIQTPFSNQEKPSIFGGIFDKKEHSDKPIFGGNLIAKEQQKPELSKPNNVFGGTFENKLDFKAQNLFPKNQQSQILPSSEKKQQIKQSSIINVHAAHNDEPKAEKKVSFNIFEQVNEKKEGNIFTKLIDNNTTNPKPSQESNSNSNEKKVSEPFSNTFSQNNNNKSEGSTVKNPFQNIESKQPSIFSLSKPLAFEQSKPSIFVGLNKKTEEQNQPEEKQAVKINLFGEGTPSDKPNNNLFSQAGKNPISPMKPTESNKKNISQIFQGFQDKPNIFSAGNAFNQQEKAPTVFPQGSVNPFGGALSGGSNGQNKTGFPKGQNLNEEEQEGGDAEEIDDDGPIEAKDEFDPSKSTGNYQYEKADVLFKQVSLKLRKGNHQIQENIIVSIQKMGVNANKQIYGRLQNKQIYFHGTIMPNVTEISSVSQNSFENISVKKLVSTTNEGKPELLLIKIKFSKASHGKEFLSKAKN